MLAELLTAVDGEPERETHLLWDYDTISKWLRLLKSAVSGTISVSQFLQSHRVGESRSTAGTFPRGCYVQWWTGRPGVLQSVGSLRVRHDWATELSWTDGGYTHSENSDVRQPLWDLGLRHTGNRYSLGSTRSPLLNSSLAWYSDKKEFMTSNSHPAD